MCILIIRSTSGIINENEFNELALMVSSSKSEAISGELTTHSIDQFELSTFNLPTAHANRLKSSIAIRSFSSLFRIAILCDIFVSEEYKEFRKLVAENGVFPTKCVGKTQRIQKEVQHQYLVMIKATKLTGGFVFSHHLHLAIKFFNGHQVSFHLFK